MKTHLSLLFIGFMLVTAQAHSQSDRIPGYIVTAAGDTIEGFIIDRKDNWSVKEIQFATSESGATTSYQTGGINSFYLKTYDAYYISKTLDIDKKPIEVSNLEDNGTRKIVTEQILLQLLAKGALNLYRYIDESNKIHFFIQKGDNKIEELAYVRYMTATRKMVELPFFKGTLQNLTTDCDKIKTAPSIYGERPLTTFVQRYNSCFGEKGQYVSKSSGANVTFGVIAGGASMSGSIRRSNDPGSVVYNGVGKYSTGTGTLFGAIMELRSNRSSNRSRPGMELVWQQYPTTTKVSGSTKFQLAFTTVNIGITYKYMFTTNKKVNPFIKAIGGAALALIAEGKRTQITTQGNINERLFLGNDKVGYHYGIGAGVSINRFAIEARYRSLLYSVDVGGNALVSGVEGAVVFMFNK